MRDILVKITDGNNVVYLQDKAYIIEEKYINKEL